MLSLFSYLASEKGEKSAALHGRTAVTAEAAAAQSNFHI